MEGGATGSTAGRTPADDATGTTPDRDPAGDATGSGKR
jgi:hypothetical protein